MQPNANLSLIYEIEKPINDRRKIFQKARHLLGMLALSLLHSLRNLSTDGLYLSQDPKNIQG